MPLATITQAFTQASASFISIKFNGTGYLVFEGRRKESIMTRAKKALASLSNDDDFLVFEMPNFQYRFFIGKKYYDVSGLNLESFLKDKLNFNIDNLPMLPAIRRG